MSIILIINHLLAIKIIEKAIENENQYRRFIRFGKKQALMTMSKLLDDGDIEGARKALCDYDPEWNKWYDNRLRMTKLDRAVECIIDIFIHVFHIIIYRIEIVIVSIDSFVTSFLFP